MTKEEQRIFDIVGKINQQIEEKLAGQDYNCYLIYESVGEVYGETNTLIKFMGNIIWQSWEDPCEDSDDPDHADFKLEKFLKDEIKDIVNYVSVLKRHGNANIKAKSTKTS